MRKTLHSFLVGAILAFSPLFCWAQAQRTDAKPAAVERTIGGIPVGAKKVDVKKTFPLLSQYLTAGKSTSVFDRTLQGQAPKTMKAAAPQRVLTLPDGKELWGFVAYKSDWTSDATHYGLYRLTAGATPTLSNMFEFASDNTYIPNGGCRFADGKFGVMYVDTKFLQYGVATVKYSEYDYLTGEQTFGPEAQYKTCAAAETAQDSETGDVYGVFYNDALTAYEYGKLNFSDLTFIDRSTIGPATKTYVALGLGSDMYLYGVASDANLYKISTVDGKETLVGPTGVANLTDADGRFYQQSGEIDQSTNTFYWAFTDKDLHSAIYTVDLATGVATKVCDTPGDAQIMGLSMPPADFNGSNPAKVDDLAAVFADGSTTGKISFTAPSKTVMGAELTGDLTYEVSLNGEVVATGSTQPGAKVSADVTATEGNNVFLVVVKQGDTASPKATTSLYVGYDTPYSVSGVKLSINSATGEATLSWKAPKGGEHDGYIGNLTYDVVRYPDGKVVSTGATATSFSETLSTEALNVYSYGVVAVNNDKRSAEELSNSVTLGKYILPPYEETFESEDNFMLYKAVNAQGRAMTWNYNSYQKVVCSPYGDPGYAADDWFITPAIKLEKDKVYRLTFFARSILSSYIERLEVRYGSSADISSLNKALLDPTDVPYDRSKANFSCELKSDRDQVIYIGFHSCSEADKYYMQLDNISIDKGMSVLSPAAVTDGKAVADASAALSATVSFKTPETALDGTALSASDAMTVSVSRDGNVVKTFSGCKPGEQLSFVDNTVTAAGTATWNVTAANSHGEGKTLNISTYVGEDTPLAPEGRVLNDLLSAVRVQWNAVPAVGKNGGVVLPANVRYRVYQPSTDSWGYLKLDKVGETAETHFDVERNTGEGDMGKCQYAVSAINDMGESDAMYTTSLVVGKPYSLPMVESFKAGKLANYWWYGTGGTEHSSLSIDKDDAADGDNGSVLLKMVEVNDTISLNSGKISLAGATHPTLLFKHKAQPGAAVKIIPVVWTPDGKSVKLDAVDYSSLTGDATWMVAKRPLDAFASQPYIIVKFIVTTTLENVDVHLDAINVRDFFDHDLSVSATMPETVERGHKTQVNVKVINEGGKSAEGFTVALKRGDKTIASQPAKAAVASFGEQSYTFDLPVSAFEPDGDLSINAVVEYAADENADNNSVAVTTNIVVSKLTPVAALTAKAQSGLQPLELSWGAVLNSSEEVVETFEDCDLWKLYDINGWNTYDGDHGVTGSIGDGFVYPNQGKKFAFMVFDPDQVSASLSLNDYAWIAHSGHQYVAAMYSGSDVVNPDGSHDIYPADNWLISPELSGEAQTISFWASNLQSQYHDYKETVDLLYSTTDTELSSFIKIGETRTVEGDVWSELTAEVPAGAKYFAIHHNTDIKNVYVLKIDDITYRRASDAPTGYNLYRNGELLSSFTSGEAVYVYTAGSGNTDGNYAVTAVYANGESEPATVNVATGIKDIIGDKCAAFDVYTVDGVLVAKGVKSLSQLKAGVYVIGDKTVVVK